MAHSDISRISRLTAILTLLQSKQIITAQQIADKFRISTRTVYRDIRALEESGVPIITEEGKGYSLMQDYLLSPIMFSEEEANALITAEKIIENNSDASFSKNYSNAIAKIKAILRYSMKGKTELLADRIQVRKSISSTQTSEHLSMLQMAITNFRVIRIDYTAENGNTTNRAIEPLALYSTQGNWALIAHCRLRNEHRAFRLDRINSYIELDEYFPPHNFSLQDFFEECRRKYYSTPDIQLSQGKDTFTSDNETKYSKKMKTNLDTFYIVGISTRTSNAPGKAEKDIPQLWARFNNENCLSQISNKASNNVYAVYTDYEGDYTKPYTLIIGYCVTDLNNIPEGLTSIKIEKAEYEKFTAKGKEMSSAVIGEWIKIWNSNLDRTYVADFEVYSEDCMKNPEISVDIFIGVK